MEYFYLRVSTQQSSSYAHNQTFDRQKNIFKQNGYDFDLAEQQNRVFCERISGGISTKTRPEFEKLLATVKKGDTIIITEMSRLARSLQDLIETVNNLIRLEIGVIFIKENIKVLNNGLDSMNRLMFNLFGAFAEFEKDLIRERTKQGLEAKKLAGVKLGRPETYNLATIKSLYDMGLKYDEITARIGISHARICAIVKEQKWTRNKKQIKINLLNNNKNNNNI